MAYELEYKKVHNTLGEPTDNKYGENIGQYVKNLAPTTSAPLFSFWSSESNATDGVSNSTNETQSLRSRRIIVGGGQIDPIHPGANDTARIFKWRNPLVQVTKWKYILASEHQTDYEDLQDYLVERNLPPIGTNDYVIKTTSLYFGIKSSSWGLSTRCTIWGCESLKTCNGIWYGVYTKTGDLDFWTYYFLIRNKDTHGCLKSGAYVRVMLLEYYTNKWETYWQYNAQDFFIKDQLVDPSSALQDLLNASYYSSFIPLTSGQNITIQPWGFTGTYVICGFVQKEQKYVFWNKTNYIGEITDKICLRIPAIGPVIQNNADLVNSPNDWDANWGDNVDQWYLIFYEPQFVGDNPQLSPYIFRSTNLLEISFDGQVVNNYGPASTTIIPNIVDTNMYTDEEVAKFLNPDLYNIPFVQDDRGNLIRPELYLAVQEVNNQYEIKIINVKYAKEQEEHPGHYDQIPLVNEVKLRNWMHYKRKHFALTIIRDTHNVIPADYKDKTRNKYQITKRFRIIRTINFLWSNYNNAIVLPSFEWSENNLSTVCRLNMPRNNITRANIKSILKLLREKKYQLNPYSDLLSVCQFMEPDNHQEINQTMTPTISIGFVLSIVPKRPLITAINRNWQHGYLDSFYNGSHVDSIPQNEGYYYRSDEGEIYSLNILDIPAK